MKIRPRNWDDTWYVSLVVGAFPFEIVVAVLLQVLESQHDEGVVAKDSFLPGCLRLVMREQSGTTVRC